MDEVKPGTMCTVIGWGKREDKNCKYITYKNIYFEAINLVF